MGLSLATAVFLLLAVGWMLLPFLPAWREIRRRTDAEPLGIERGSEVDVRRFARGFRAWLDSDMAAALAAARSATEQIEGETEDTAYVVVPAGGTCAVPADERESFARLVLGGGDLELPTGCVFESEIHAAGRLSGGDDTIVRAVLADRDVSLGAGSAVLRWLHAGGDLTVGRGCFLGGRVSADGEAALACGISFERLHAPSLEFGFDAARPPVAGDAAQSDLPTLAAGDVPRLRDERGGRWLIAGDFELPAGTRLEHDVVVTGDAVLREGSRLVGSLKSRGTLTTERGVRVEGSLVSRGDLVIGADNVVAGPVIGEEVVRLGQGAVVGTRERPTTVTAEVILVAPGCRCHGTVWAHRQGDILAPVAGGAA